MSVFEGTGTSHDIVSRLNEADDLELDFQKLRQLQKRFDEDGVQSKATWLFDVHIRVQTWKSIATLELIL